ncbi:protein SRG1-like isoform X2 [Punica granatum]|uniref:Protein SRG1-like isoform X2 n=1 Tax=Punica granatum TaxID=22663 RepID=A0A6P8D5E9_PUNGR|nr:protein SRG1-like isoform X2 [Punica granatum]
MAGSDNVVVEAEDVPIYVSSLPVPNVQEMVRENPLRVPERYLRTKEEISESEPGYVNPMLPVLDLSLLVDGNAQELDKLDLACKDWGFFQVVNHGAATEVMNMMRAAAIEFFKLPLEEKNKFAMPANDIQGYGHTNVETKDQKLDWSDTLVLAVYPERFRRPQFWPSTPPHFKKAMETYANEIRTVGDKLIGSLATVMGLNKDAMLKLHGELVQGLRLNYYPSCVKPNDVYGISPHSDATIVSILMQDSDTDGLQIRHEGHWVPIKPIPVLDKREVQEHRAQVNDKREEMEDLLCDFHISTR